MTLLLLAALLAAAYAVRRTFAWLATLGPRLRRPALTATAVALAAYHWPTVALTLASVAALAALAAATVLTRIPHPHPHPTSPPTDPADLDPATP